MTVYGCFDESVARALAVHDVFRLKAVHDVFWPKAEHDTFRLKAVHDVLFWLFFSIAHLCSSKGAHHQVRKNLLVEKPLCLILVYLGALICTQISRTALANVQQVRERLSSQGLVK